ncbi:MAG: transcriptional repressor [Phycisphaerae bacterium]|nr:transcriptional repressor [Phycisphaerae bacterium]
MRRTSEVGGLAAATKTIAIHAMLAQIRSLFAHKRLRCTAQRAEVYAALRGTRSHPTAEQLYRLVHAQSPGTSLATVYNTLDVLCEAGLARRLPTAGGVARYDADISDHLHAVTADGQVLDVPADLCGEILQALPEGIRARLETRLGAEVRHLSVQFSDRPVD